MSLAVTFISIPQLVSSAVPDAAKKTLAPVASGQFTVRRLVAKVTDAGSHTAFVLSFEGKANDGIWIPLGLSIFNPVMGLTIDQNGIQLSSALAVAGVMFNFDAQFPAFRVGIGGDNAAGDGAAFARVF